MITFRCTRHLLSLLNVKVVDEPPPSTSALGNWYAKVGWTGAGDLIVIANEKSLLAVAIPIQLLPEIEEWFAVRYFNLLLGIGVPSDIASRELAKTQEICYARTASRSMLGSLNDICNQCDAYVEAHYDSETLSLSEIERNLAGLPHLRPDIMPYREAIRLLKAFYGY